MSMPSPTRTALATAMLSAMTSLVASAAVVGSVAQVASASRRCGRSDLATYTVADGDTWFDIAHSVGVGMSSLFDANDADDESAIHPGDVLCLPSGASASGADGGTSGSGSGGCVAAYTVATNDSWFSIAKAAGVSMSRLLDVNDATAKQTIYPGSSVCLPAGASMPASSKTSNSSNSSNSSTPASINGLEAFPVEGPCWFADTWLAPRGNGRRHQGVDLIADQGQYLYAVTDGTLTNRAWDQPGLLAGNAWWLTSDDGSGTYYFYGHLYAFAPGLKVGSKVRAGQIIGFVGETGSAATPHLHFEMHPNGGGAINPYPTIKAMNGCKTTLLYEQPGGWTPEG